jgi:hypothetical protein
MNPTVATHGPTTCLSVSGQGEPGGGEYAAAVQAIYTVATALGAGYAPLEGQWWVEDERPALEVPRERWRWHLMLPLPATPSAGTLEAAREHSRVACPAAYRIRLATVAEGECVELLHEGPFSEEPRSLKVMHDYMAEQGLVPNGPHHEVYLSPPDDPAPRTLLRQPVRPA